MTVDDLQYAAAMAGVRSELLSSGPSTAPAGVAFCRDCGRTVTLTSTAQGARVALEEHAGGPWELDGGLAKYVGEDGTHAEHRALCRRADQ